MIQITRKLSLLCLCIIIAFGIVACQPPQPNSPFGPINIETQGKGIYIIRESDLERMGTQFPESGKLRLTWMGEEVPAWMMELENAAIEKSIVFYSQNAHSRYSLINTFQLVSDSKPLPHLQPMAPGFGISSSPILTWLMLEADLIYEPQSASESHYLWTTITTSTPFQTSFSLQGLDTDRPARVSVSLRKRGAVDKHLIKVQINDSEINEISWEGDPEKFFDFQITAGTLIEGENKIEIEIAGEEDDRMVVDLDWVKIEYYRKSFQEINNLEWRGRGDFEVIGGWNGVTLTLPINGGEGWISQAGPGGVVSYTTDLGEEYVTADESGWQFPRFLRPIHSINSLEMGFSGADYVIFTPSIWEPDLEPLAEYYRNQGLKTTIANLDAVYDRFSGGQVNPTAIQAYLQNGLTNWQVQPKYALLVGDFVNDPSRLPESGVYLPGFFINTQYGGETVSDYPFSLGKDGIPRIAIGRWPVNNRVELNQLVSNTINPKIDGSYDLLVSSIVDPSDPSFSGTQEIFSRLLKSYGSSSSTVFFPTNQEKPPEVDSSVLVYFGHGSLTTWGNPPQINTAMFTKQWNNPPEIILQFTCLTGYFISPENLSLSEVLLQSGVPAVIGPTSLTLPGDQWLLVENWVNALHDPDLIRVGDLLLYVWQNTSSESGVEDITQTYQLFGDPAYSLLWKAKK